MRRENIDNPLIYYRSHERNIENLFACGKTTKLFVIKGIYVNRDLLVWVYSSVRKIYYNLWYSFIIKTVFQYQHKISAGFSTRAYNESIRQHDSVV